MHKTPFETALEKELRSMNLELGRAFYLPELTQMARETQFPLFYNDITNQGGILVVRRRFARPNFWHSISLPYQAQYTNATEQALEEAIARGLDTDNYSETVAIEWTGPQNPHFPARFFNMEIDKNGYSYVIDDTELPKSGKYDPAEMAAIVIKHARDIR